MEKKVEKEKGKLEKHKKVKIGEEHSNLAGNFHFIFLQQFATIVSFRGSAHIWSQPRISS